MGNHFMSLAFLCLIASVLCVDTSTPELASNKSGGWYGILNQLTIRNKKLSGDVHRCDLTNKRLTSRILRKTEDLEKIKQDLKKAEKVIDFCQRARTEVKPSCAAWKKEGFTEDGNYVIDPDGHGNVRPFLVECQMNSRTGDVVTVIHHDSESRSLAGSGCEKPLTCQKIITYQATMAQIEFVIGNSKKCKQFMRYDCFASVIFLGKTQFLGWYSRGGALMDYFGGATPGSRKCACGMTHSCYKSNDVCNCEANDAVWRSDFGYLHDMATLPVTKLAFGDLGHPYERGYYLLGPLKCYV